ncbi:MAG: NADH-quinone oxidoreductase subunit J [Ardenticatenaceae bacterium]|nr:NADH-quinone oxidoreductase subunit J [Ardenticatenaceae bacterium]HBY98556.1 NADH-quinone oxidoreductase subunit J [Chloroflexota bacterium]
MSAQLIFFLFLALVAVATALAMIFARNAVYAVLLMVVNFATVAVVFLTLQATFLAAVQVVVYAGAIMVLFLFVVMLMGPNPAPLWEHLPGQRPLALLLGLLLVVGLITAVNVPKVSGVAGNVSPEAAQMGNPQLVGQTLFAKYVLPFEVTSVLLLIAMIGAVTLAKRHTSPTISRPAGEISTSL